jgi:hypothetical protein
VKREGGEWGEGARSEKRHDRQLFCEFQLTSNQDFYLRGHLLPSHFPCALL